MAARQIGRLVIGLLATSAAAGCGDDRQPSLRGDFLALSYNVAGLPQGLSGGNPAVHMPLIAPLLNGYDLVLLQESWKTPEPNRLAPLRVYHEILEAASEHPYRSEPMPLPIGSNTERPTAIVSDGLNRFSRFPFGEVQRRRWEECDNSAADCLSLKGFSVARTEVADGVCIDVYNLHGEAGNTENDLRLRDENTTAMIAFIENFSAGRAVIVGGDFNMRLIRARDAANLTRFTTEVGLADACIALGVIDETEIDKFFFRSGETVSVDPLSCRFDTDIFIDEEGGPLSDHEPLAVRFAWQASARSSGCRFEP